MASSDDEVADEWYATLGDDLSQGDIVDIVPGGLIEAPLTICQPLNRSEQGKANYAPLAALTKRRGVEFIHAKGDVGLGMVIWPDCQIDKFKNQSRPEGEWFTAVAPVFPIAKIGDTAVHAKVLALNRAQFFPLPAKPPHIPTDSYVDLRHIWPVRYSLLRDRKLALSREARDALAFHLFWFQTEVRVTPSVPCPHCSKPVDSSAFFQFKDGGEAED